MEFVMVPVPEEYVHDVTVLIHKLALQGTDDEPFEPWTDAAMGKFFLEADEETRSILSLTARGALADKRVTDQAVADFLQLSPRETVEIVGRLKEQLRRAQCMQLVEVEVVSVPTPSGRVRERRVLRMRKDLARLVRNAERAVQAIEPHPLAGTR
jgi:hypothetical protein